MNMLACALQAEVGMDGADDMDGSTWDERVWELPLTAYQKYLAERLLVELELPDEELELLVPHDKELALANIKAEFAKRRCRMRGAVGGLAPCKAAIMSRRIANQRIGRALQV